MLTHLKQQKFNNLCSLHIFLNIEKTIAYDLHFHLNNWKKMHQFSELLCQIENAAVMLDFVSIFSFWGWFVHFSLFVWQNWKVMVWQEIAFDERLINCNWQFKTKWTIEQQRAIEALLNCSLNIYNFSCFDATDNQPVKIEYEEKQVTMKLLNLTEDNKVSFSANFWFSVWNQSIRTDQKNPSINQLNSWHLRN